MDQTISAGAANFFIEANTGAATGSFHGFQNLSDENLKTNLRPVRRPAHEGGIRRIELVKKAGRRFRLSLRAYVSRMFRERFPSQTWTSIAVLYNPSMPLHRDILNMIGHANHAITLGNFMEGRVWIEDENGQATALLETKSGQKLLRGTWVDMHDKAVSFNARKYHMLEKHRGNMWALGVVGQA